jgi:hypothetical protein
MNKIQEYLGFTRKSCPGLRANKAFIVVLILGIIAAFSGVVKAEDNETKKVEWKEWTTQLLYDTTNACYQGTIRWIVISNPALIGQIPDIAAQRQMIVHCFCVMDRIRKEFKIEEYQKGVYDQNWAGNLFMTKAVECVKEENTLPNFFTAQIPKAKIDDNETKKVIPEELEDSKEELPSPKLKESEEDSTTIFQG